MRVLRTTTVRFTEVVARAGAPSVYTLWQKPKADSKFQTLIKKHRVITILPNESGTDFGQVGFREKKGARYLAFPRSLKAFVDQRIIGIKWELIRE